MKKQVTNTELLNIFKSVFSDFKDECKANTEWKLGDSGSWTQNIRKGNAILKRIEEHGMVKEQEQKTRYFLFGEQNVKAFMEGMPVFRKHIRSGETAYTCEWKPGDDVTNLLEAMNGCFDYAELTKKEYDQIQKL